MASARVSRTFIRRMSLKQPPGEGTFTSDRPLGYQKFIRNKEGVYINSTKPSHLNSKYSARNMVMAAAYTFWLIPVMGYTYNTDKYGTKKH